MFSPRSFIRVASLIASVIACGVASSARADAWSEKVRGSWVAGENDQGGIVLAKDGQGCEIVVAPTEQSCVQQAAKFLAGDIETISGFKPQIVAKPTSGKPAIHLTTAANDNRWEAFDIRTSADGNLDLIGSNPRGTAFAAYTLSERIGIDPLHHWTLLQPEHHATLKLKPIDYSSGPPTFKYRGMFHDDEDILPRPFEPSGYPLRTGDVPTEWYAKYFETALRLRMNMVAPYTRVHRRYEVQKMASDWGLFYTSHHYDILLSNPFGIERYGLGKARELNGPWDWINNREGMLRYWRGGVEENKDLDCIWPVGMRGTDDTGYKFPKNMSEAKQGEIFKQVIAEQVKIVKALVPPDKKPVYHWTLYTEMLPKYKAGTLDVPDDVIIVWPDDNDGRMRGLPEGKDKWKHGVYYHLAYLGPQIKQNAHIVQPGRIAEEFGKIVDAGATEYMLVNVSELREFVMEARMLGDICWDAKGTLQPGDAADRFVNWWCREYFGDAAAKPAAAAYSEYYQKLDTFDKLFADSDRVHAELGRLSRFVNGDKSTKPASSADLNELQQRVNRLTRAIYACEQAAKAMPADRRQFFFDHCELPLLFALRPAESAYALAQVPLDDADSVVQHAAAAMPPLEQLETEILRAEHPPFEKWYRETWIRRGPKSANVHRPYEEMRQFLATQGREYDLPDPEPARRRAATSASTKP